jgi:anaerobic selenocysteine-containing dehydrogenase
MLLNVLTGSVGTVGGTSANGWNKFIPVPPKAVHPQSRWNELTWPIEYPLAHHEMSFLLPYFLAEGRGRLDVYFTRVYNPVWTNPDGFSWIEALSDPGKVGLHVALTPTWSETAFFADYVLPMGLGSERHDIHSYEQYDGQWVGFRQPVLRAARERAGGSVDDTREVNPGEVWEENEFWIELSWRIDPDGSLGIRKFFESKQRPGDKLGVDEYYGWIFENSVPGLPAKAAAEGLTPLQYMRRYGAYEVRERVGRFHEEEVPRAELEDVKVDKHGRAYTKTPAQPATNVVPIPTPPGDAEGRRPVGVLREGKIVRGFPTPTGKLEFWSRTLTEWGWPEYALPAYIRSHIHPDNLAPGQVPLISTFRLPVQIHTRSGNSKWLDEIAHTNPLWLHTSDAERLGVRTGDLVRVETRIGYFVVKAWVTEGIRPGVVACSHHMGRWKISEGGQRQIMATVSLEHDAAKWAMKRERGVAPFSSSDPDTSRIWWTDVGVHQNLTFPVQPDPISGMHCWHQAVRVTRARPDDRYGDIAVDTGKAREVYREWLERTRPADRHSPDGSRRPYWLLRPLKPSRDAYRLPARV